MANFLFSDRVKGNKIFCNMNCTFNDTRYNADVLLDSGASSILVPLLTLGVPKDEIYDLKKKYIAERRRITPLSGVERTFRYTQQDIERMSDQEKLDCTGLAFDERLENMSLNGMHFGSGKVRVSCDSDGSILIGMPILLMMYNCFGVSKKTGKPVFIARHKNYTSVDYLNALEEHFGLYSKDKVLQVAIDAKEIAVQESGVRDVAAAFDDYFSRNLKGV